MDNEYQSNITNFLGSNRWTLFLIPILVVTSLILFFLYMNYFDNAIKVEDQVFDVEKGVLVEEVRVSQVPVFLTVHIEEYNNEGVLIGQLYLETPDVYKDVRVPLVFSDVFYTQEYQEKIKPGSNLYVSLYNDVNNDEVMKRHIDKPVTTLFGQRVQAKFRILE